MSVRNLEALFQPRSVAVVGASNRKGSVGHAAMRNLLRAGLEGPILPVNPKHQAVAGVLTWPDVERLPLVPDLAVICTPPATVPDLIAAFGRRGTKAAVVISAGLDRPAADGGASIQQRMLEAARPHCLRVLGPNCIGLLVPGLGLNASFAPVDALPGRLAFATQSGGLVTAVLDYARARAIGFSHFISLGNSADVDAGDVLDYLAGDPATAAILLYLESIRDARKFMSAARAAASNKPVIAVKAGRFGAAARAAASHTGALAGSDLVYDAALRRAGVLRVDTIEDLFGAVELLGRSRRVAVGRVAILTNGGGPGVMATDALLAQRGVLADLDPATVARLDATLPANWSRANPVDVVGDADAERHRIALNALLDDPGVDAVLVIHVPTAVVAADDVARTVAQLAAGAGKQVLACWLGASTVEEGRRILNDAGVPTFATPEQAVLAIQHLRRFHQNQEVLRETPPAHKAGLRADPVAARGVIAPALAERRERLTLPEAEALLAAFGIPVVASRLASDPDEAATCAGDLGFPVALKVVSPDVVHKSDVGAVVLHLDTPEAVREAAVGAVGRVQRHQPGARIRGFLVQAMAVRPRAHELILGIKADPTFGPVVLFGQGGTAVEVVQDMAVALPPLNLRLARDLVERTRVAALLKGYRDRRPAAMDALLDVLLRLAQLAADLPEVRELDINPLLLDEDGAVALDARVVVGPAERPAPAHLAIRPYPQDLEEWIEVGRRRVLLRPVRPEDEPAHREFFARLSPEDVRRRFFRAVHELSRTELARYTHIDYDREMAFIAQDPADPEGPRTLGVGRVVADPDGEVGEFALTVRTDMQRRGLGGALLDKVIRYAKARGLRRLVGWSLSDNRPMVALAQSRGFVERALPQGEVELTLDLVPPG